MGMLIRYFALVLVITFVSSVSAQSGSRGGGGGGGGSSSGGGGGGSVGPGTLGVDPSDFVYSLYEQSLETRAYDGIITMVERGRLFWDFDGKDGPIPTAKGTRLIVTAPAEASTLKRGSWVTVMGRLERDRSISSARVEVHQTPRVTLSEASTIIVDPLSPQLTIRGRITNTKPLAIRTYDGIAASEYARPISNLSLRIELEETQDAITASVANQTDLVSKGDAVTVVVRRSRPNAAHAVLVRRDEPFESRSAR